MCEGTVERTANWEAFSKDAPVKVTGTTRSKWRFVCHCRNRETGSEWIDVYGGPSGHQSIRSFRLDQVILIVPKVRRPRKAKTTC